MEIFDPDMLMAAAIWGAIALWLFTLWAFLGFLLGRIAICSDTVQHRRSRILRALRWVWQVPLYIALVILALASVWP